MTIMLGWPIVWERRWIPTSLAYTLVVLRGLMYVFSKLIGDVPHSAGVTASTKWTESRESRVGLPDTQHHWLCSLVMFTADTFNDRRQATGTALVDIMHELTMIEICPCHEKHASRSALYTSRSLLSSPFPTHLLTLHLVQATSKPSALRILKHAVPPVTVAPPAFSPPLVDLTGPSPVGAAGPIHACLSATAVAGSGP